MPDPSPTVGSVEAWRTFADGSLLLARDPRDADLVPIGEGGGSAVVIDVDPDERFQPIEGFGAAVTGSAAHVLTEYLSETEREALLRELFDPEAGIGLSYVRFTIGASDFSLSDYTYNDLPPGETDPDLSEFSIDPDRKAVVPVLQQVLGIAPEVGVMGTPWSPPAWMKTSGALEGGSLRAAAYPSLAEYLVRTVEAFGAEGIPVRALTVQNEPLFAAPYPSMLMTAAQQALFVGDHLGPLLESRGLDTEVIAYDHNWDRPDYPLSVLGNSSAAPYVDGSAFHCYAGDVSAMGQVYAAYPDKALHFTECSGGDFAPDFRTNLSFNARNIIVGTTRNGSRSALLWNLALDETSGPTNGGCQDCRGVVTVNSQTGAVTRNVEYYALGHAAKFVRPGAVRIGSTETSGQGLHNVAFQNPDGRYALVAYNDTSSARAVQVRLGGNAFTYTLPAGGFVTFRWSEPS